MNSVTRKPVSMISDQARQKPSCAAKEDGKRLEFGAVGSRGIVLYMKRENKGDDLRTAQVIHAFVFAFAKRRVSHDAAHTLFGYKLLSEMKRILLI